MAEKWTMPEWMEPFRDSINSTGGNSVETLLNRLDSESHLSKTNLPVFVMAVAVNAQVDLLIRLRDDGKLREE